MLQDIYISKTSMMNFKEDNDGKREEGYGTATNPNGMMMGYRDGNKWTMDRAGTKNGKKSLQPVGGIAKMREKAQNKNKTKIWKNPKKEFEVG